MSFNSLQDLLPNSLQDHSLSLKKILFYIFFLFGHQLYFCLDAFPDSICSH